MIIEPATLYPQLFEEEAYLEEAYAILEEGLVQILTNPAAQLDYNHTDYLDAVLAKINFSITQAIDEEDKLKLLELKKAVWKEISNSFLKIYDGLVDVQVLSTLTNTEIRFIYYLFFFSKRQNIHEFVVNKIFKDREALSKHYSKERKKDFMHSRLQEELAEIKNKSLISLIANSEDIIGGCLNGGCFFEDIIGNLEMSFGQVELLDRLLPRQNTELIFSNFVKGFKEHYEYPHFVLDIRDSLIDLFKNIP